MNNENSDCESDDDGGFDPFSFLKSGGITFESIEEVVEVDVAEDISFLKDFERLLIVKDISKFDRLKESYNANSDDLRFKNLFDLVSMVLNGKHLDILHGGVTQLQPEELYSICENESNAADLIQKITINYIVAPVSSSDREYRTLLCLIMGIAYFELYLQLNYTGPEPSETSLRAVFKNDRYRSRAIQGLECDGAYPYGGSLCQIPEALFFSRVIFSTIAFPSRAMWKHGISLSLDGTIFSKSFDFDTQKVEAINLAAGKLSTRYWWSVRAAVIHGRLLQGLHYESFPRLWLEVKDSFFTAIDSFPIEHLFYGESFKEMKSQLLTEWGLCCHHFEFSDKGKAAFSQAREISELYVLLTAAMGKRTKYQKDEHAQMFLYAKSSLLEALETTSEIPKTSGTDGEIEIGAKIVDGIKTVEAVEKRIDSAGSGDVDGLVSGWQHGEWELGRRLVTEAINGEEVAVREVMLDSMDGGPVENILIEGGPKFSDKCTDKGGSLHPVDQSIILALCLDVSNNNPQDGLTAEEMFPYIQRVLDQANNWMIHSTALLQRSWLEYEKRRTADRAMLQMQALLDQHTTKLTMTQSTRKSIEESAPTQDRLRYINCIVYPSQYELKKDLASRYLRCQVFASALNLFRELELWDDVVTCYQLLQKPSRAELVVREQLKIAETPYMLTALADLTGDESYYERAWTLSEGRYARAKRTLAKISFDRNDFKGCCDHITDALAVQPMVAHSWYLKGIACMRLELMDEALNSFTRCIQQDMEVGEAWANIGAIHMSRKNFPVAFSSFEEALKHKTDNWKIIENLMLTSLALEKYFDTIKFMEKLLSLRCKSNRPVHKAELRALSCLVASLELTNRSKLVEANVAEDADNKKTVTSNLAKRFIILFDKIFNSLEADSELFDIYADFEHSIGRIEESRISRTKEVRIA